MIYYTDLNNCGARLEKATEGSFGYDIRSLDSCTLAPGEIRKISTGLLIDLSASIYAALVLSRSGLASKGIIVANAPGLIDADYRGEIGVLLWNATNDSFRVNVGDRIAQMIFVQVTTNSLTYDATDINYVTKRGSKGFGSTGI